MRSVVIVTRTAKKKRPPRVYAHKWKGHQRDNMRYLHERGRGPSYISEVLGIPLDCVKYELYKKPKRKPAVEAAKREERAERAKLYKPAGW